MKLHNLRNLFYLFFCSPFFQYFFASQQSAAHCCWSMFILWIPKTKSNLFWDCSPDLLIKYSGHASESFRWILISATLESDIVLSGADTLWKFCEIYITLCSQVATLLRIFAKICMSATLDSHIVLSGGHALWKFLRHLFHSQISSGHQP